MRRIIYSLALLPTAGYTKTLGQVAGGLTEVASGVSTLINNVCYIVGVALLVGSLMRFKEHRDNPQQVPLSQPIALLLLGLFIAAIPIIAGMSAASESVR